MLYLNVQLMVDSTLCYSQCIVLYYQFLVLPLRVKAVSFWPLKASHDVESLYHSPTSLIISWQLTVTQLHWPPRCFPNLSSKLLLHNPWTCHSLYRHLYAISLTSFRPLLKYCLIREDFIDNTQLLNFWIFILFPKTKNVCSHAYVCIHTSIFIYI